MQRDTRAFLWDAHEAAQLIAEFTRTLTFEDYSASRLVQSAVERQFEVIGEALNQLSKLEPSTAANIPELSRIVAFRNVLIHGYATLNQAHVWLIVQESLPDLVSVLIRLLDESSSSTK
jgi:uncharacterized protein with HEPN domain